jgi:hypothetical protein
VGSQAANGIIQWKSSLHIKIEHAIRINMACAVTVIVRAGLVPYAIQPLRLIQHLLDHQGININKTELQQVERENGNLLVFQIIGRHFPTFAKVDRTIDPVPAFNHIQPCIDFPTEFF